MILSLHALCDQYTVIHTHVGSMRTDRYKHINDKHIHTYIQKHTLTTHSHTHTHSHGREHSLTAAIFFLFVSVGSLLQK